MQLLYRRQLNKQACPAPEDGAMSAFRSGSTIPRTLNNAKYKDSDSNNAPVLTGLTTKFYLLFSQYDGISNM